MIAVDVVGLGVTPLDMLYLVDEFPAGETVQQAHKLAVQGGGPVATAMATLAKLGARPAMLDALGDDWRADHIWTEFVRDGVVTNYLVRREGHTSATAAIMVQRKDGARAIVHIPGDVPELTPSELPRDLVQSAKILHLNGRHWRAALQAVRWANKAGVTVSFDGGAHRFRPELTELVPLTDICIVARHFAQAYTNQAEIPLAAEALLSAGPALVVITSGLAGSWIFPKGKTAFHQPAFPMPHITDTTGCGDSYHGAFLFGLLQEMSLRKTARLASAVAALNTQRLGGRAALPTLAAVEDFLRTRS